MIVRPVLAGAGIGALVPFRERHFAAADGEWTLDRNDMLRLFIRRVAGPHDEIP